WCTGSVSTTRRGTTTTPSGRTEPGTWLTSASHVVGRELCHLCDLGVVADEAPSPVPAQNAHTGHFGRRMRAPRGRAVPPCPVGPGRELKWSPLGACWVTTRQLDARLSRPGTRGGCNA